MVLFPFSWFFPISFAQWRSTCFPSCSQPLPPPHFLSPPFSSPASGPADVRLVNGPDSCTGRLEVFYNGTWGTVCDDHWDLAGARVVCRQLGCGMALAAPGGARYGGGEDPIWLDNVRCSGVEDALSQCPARPWGDNNCAHGEDASVVCSGEERAPAAARVSCWGWPEG